MKILTVADLSIAPSRGDHFEHAALYGILDHWKGVVGLPRARCEDAV